MPDRTKIEWADATINPFPGCSRARLPDGSTSPACVGCYAERIAARMSTNPIHDRYHGLAVYQDGQPQWTGRLKLVQSELDKPRRWARPRTIFVESMGDIAHESITAELFAHLWSLLVQNQVRHQPHTFYLLTKRPAHLAALLEAMRKLCCDEIYWKVMAWVVAMTTAESQAAADARVPELLRCPALHFGVSAEPLVGPLDLRPWFLRRNCEHPAIRGCDCCQCVSGSLCMCRDCGCPCHRGLGWVITGGWSGPQATPSHPQWFRDLRDQAAAAGVPFMFKQWGEWAPVGWCHFDSPAPGNVLIQVDGRILPQHPRFVPDAAKDSIMEMHRVGKRCAGRLLDGQEHNGAPVVGLAAG